MVDGALVIGYSENHDDYTMSQPSQGIIGARTENLTFKNIKFYNFDVANKSAIGSCSHCFVTPSTDSGARTTTFSGLYFDKSVSIKIRYQTPNRDIFRDLDGTLTGLGPNSWATPWWRHNLQPGCEHKQHEYDGIVCDSRSEIRRVVFYNFAPAIFGKQYMKILQWDDSIVGSMDNTTKKAYMEDLDNYSMVNFRAHVRPENAWAIPIVTGHKYRIHWGYGLDFTQMQVDLSPLWKHTDQDLYFVHNFTDVRAAYDFQTAKTNVYNNGSIFSSDPKLHQTGAVALYNETSVRELHFLINGKNWTRRDLVMTAIRCIGSCLAVINTTVPIETNVRYWSNASSWNNSKVPLEGEDIVIPPGQNFVFDMEVSPIYRYIQINGRVTFLNSANKLHLRAKYIFVRAGELIIGNQTHPFLGEQAEITLYGARDEASIVYDNAIEAGNKVLANTANLTMFGKPRIHRTRLLATAPVNSTSILVESGLSWVAGEKFGLAPSTMNWDESDYAIISSYNNDTGLLVADRPLEKYHWGAPNSTAPNYNGIDMRTEVMLLSRNIRIQGNDSDAWGCQVVTSDFYEGDG